ncbi:MAG: hypothetical protein WKG00_24670 [Polyangiaceae bacterium]
MALLGLAAFGVGCGGCSDDPSLNCDDAGNCEICDAYGCRPADPSGSNARGGGGWGNASGPGARGAPGASGGGSASGGTGGVPVCDGNEAACPCDDDSECTAAGTQCVGGICIDGCEFSYQCGAGKVCADGQCVAECVEPVDCPAGYTCGPAGVCVVDPSNPACDADTPCTGPDEVCEGGLCVEPCSANVDCGEGEICNAAEGHCIPDPSPKPVCSDTVACSGAGQACLEDGYCHYACTEFSDCQVIAGQFVACQAGPGGAKVCKTLEETDPECTLSDPCPDGQSCVSNECH